MNSESVVNSLSTISVIDALVLILLVISLIRGLVRGLSGELAGLLSAAIALAAGWYGFRPLGEWVETHTRLTGRPAFAFAFALAVLGGYVAMRILRLALRSISEFSFKGAVERVGGALAGLLHGSIVAAVLLLFLSLWPADPLHRWITEESFAGRFVSARLRPWYDSLVEQHPDLPLPRPPGPPPTPSEPSVEPTPAE